MEKVLELVEELAKPFEKCSLEAYWDCAGYPTNGWGNLLSRERRSEVMKRLELTSEQVDLWLQETWPPITQEEADSRFLVNLNKAYTSVKRLVKIQLSANQLAALTDFAFNLGSGNLQISTLLRLVNRGEFVDASDEFLKWNKAGGIVYRGLTRRRNVERKLFLGP